MKKLFITLAIVLCFIVPAQAQAIDIVDFINTEWTAASTTQKVAMLNDFCAAYNYSAIVVVEGETVANPETKKMFMNRKIREYIRNIVHQYRARIAKQAAIYTPLPDME